MYDTNPGKLVLVLFGVFKGVLWCLSYDVSRVK